MKIRPGTDWATAPRTSPSCDTWRSTSCKRTQPRDLCAGSSSAPAGTTPTSPVCSPYSEVRLPCPAMDFLCYLHEGWQPLIRPAEPTRAWMDATPEAFAYRCLPLNIANAHGWEILPPVRVGDVQRQAAIRERLGGCIHPGAGGLRGADERLPTLMQITQEIHRRAG